MALLAALKLGIILPWAAENVSRQKRSRNLHSVTLKDMAVLAGRDDNIHNHPLIKSLGMKFIISSFAAVKCRFAALEA